MKKTLSMLMIIVLMLVVGGATWAENYSVGVCQLMVHDSLDQATQGFLRSIRRLPSTPICVQLLSTLSMPNA